MIPKHKCEFCEPAQVFLIVLLVLDLGCSSKEPGAIGYVFSGRTMGTRYNVKLADGIAEEKKERLRQKVDEKLALIDARMSTYNPESEVSRFNRYSKKEWFFVSKETYTVLRSALRIGGESGGALDITVGPLVELWGFGATRRREAPPPRSSVEQVKARVGYEKIELDPKKPRLRKRDKKVQLDLSAIAKGFAVDAVFEILEKENFERFLVEIGGEVRAKGEKSAGNPWMVGIERPKPNVREIQRSVPLLDAALATSGDYRNFFEFHGVRYSHAMDPFTGYPVHHHLVGVTVKASTCMEADGWATALMVLGPEKGFEMAKEHGVSALFLIRTSKGVVERYTPHF